MPAPPILPSTARVAIQGTYGATDWVNIVHCKTVESGTPTDTDVLGLVTEIFTQWAVKFAGSMSPNWSCDSASIVYYPVAGGEMVNSYSNPVPGTDTGIDLPASVAMCIGWSISSHYRGGHPRSYLSGLVTDRLLNQKSWTAATLTEFTTQAGLYITAVNSYTNTHFSSVTCGTLRQFANGGSNTRPRTYLNPPLFFPIVSALARSTCASQRRRVER